MGGVTAAMEHVFGRVCAASLRLYAARWWCCGGDVERRVRRVVGVVGGLLLGMAGVVGGVYWCGRGSGCIHR